VPPLRILNYRYLFFRQPIQLINQPINLRRGAGAPARANSSATAAPPLRIFA
jgi:hypothetical protein